jgi:uncharacterized protein YbbC (DUF1343 family)
MHTGLMRLMRDPKRYLDADRIGLVANPTTVDGELRHAADLLHAHPDVRLVTLFGPEHGLRAVAQYMEGVAGGERDAQTGLPVVSLYGATEDTLAPHPDHLGDLDTLVFDIQDVGARYYTYAATMALCMRAARKANKRVVVLDRPNPLGGVQVEGSGLHPGLENFCGLYPVPQRHGMTVGELARLYNTAFGIGCELTVVPMEGWRRPQYYDETGLFWVLPSPNMPTLDTALVYPGMCLLEATNISEGRGTTRPFELFGAPYIDAVALCEALAREDLPGVLFRPCHFRPTFDKFTGEACQGAQIHVRSRSDFLSYRTGLAVITVVRRLWPRHFAWRTAPYEFRDDVPAIDLLTGNGGVRLAIDAGKSVTQVLEEASFGTEAYDAGRPAALLY